MRLSSDNIRLLDVLNELSKLRRNKLSGRTRIKALIDFLKEYSYNDSSLKGTKFYLNITKDTNS
jgi:hemerythrin-like domain-containing protein